MVEAHVRSFRTIVWVRFLPLAFNKEESKNAMVTSNIDKYIEALRAKIVERALMDFCINDKELADLKGKGLIGAGTHERVNEVTSTMTRDEIQKHFDHFVELKARNRTNNE